MSNKYPAFVVVVVVVITVMGFFPVGGAFGGIEGEASAPFEVEMVPGEVSEQGVGERLHPFERPVSDKPIEGEAELESSSSLEGIMDAVQEEACIIPHPPIHIDGNDDFLKPGSGVIGGAGIEEAPYLIAGWCIDRDDGTWDGLGLAPDQPEGIILENTDAHVLILDNAILNHDGFGVFLRHAENVEIRDNTITDNSMGAWLEDSSGNVVQGNTFTGNDAVGVILWSSTPNNIVQDNTITGTDGAGVGLIWSSENVVRGNTITDNDGYGVASSGSDEITVQDNIVTHNLGGVHTFEVSASTVEGNTITENTGRGVQLIWSDENTVQGNKITDNDEYGVVLSGSENTVQSNNVTGNWYGMYLSGSENTVQGNNITGNTADGVSLFLGGATVVQGNTITDNDGAGVLLRGSTESTVQNNTITGNENGIRLDEGRVGRVPSGTIIEGNDIHDNAAHGLDGLVHEDAVQAAGNWWGDASGPSGGAEDACTGTLAQGDGESIHAADEVDVCFDPWIEERNP